MISRASRRSRAFASSYDWFTGLTVRACSLWLARVITLGLFKRYSIENGSSGKFKLRNLVTLYSDDNFALNVLLILLVLNLLLCESIALYFRHSFSESTHLACVT